MTEKELFYGLHNYSPEFQKFYRDAMTKASDEDRKFFDKIYEHEKNMTDQEKKSLDQDKKQFWKDLVAVFKKGLKIDHPEVQRAMQNYINFSKENGIEPTQKMWLQSIEAFRRMPDSFRKTVERFPELESHYKDHIKRFDDNPGLENFLAEAMKLYAEKNLL